MKVLFINSVCGIGSTGRICTDLAQKLEAEGCEVKIAYGRKGTVPEPFKKYAVRIGTDFDCKVHALQTRLFDAHGFGSKYATGKFLQWAESYAPDMLWLHNIHGYYINVEMLFAWIKKHPDMQVKWTLHDCWAFTGHCAYFTYVHCEQWKQGCMACCQLRRYPMCIGKGAVKDNYARKKAAFMGVKNMTLITPSKWLADLTRQSFLKGYPVEVHYNTINTEVFKPTPSNFRKENNLCDKIIVLGVANIWEERKGFRDFYELSQMLDDKYVIVLVGLSDSQLKKLPENIIGIRRTDTPQQLAKIYTAADIFVNPTYEDNYPTVNLEAQACGTPVITYDVGGCRETLNLTQSCAVPTGQLSEVMQKILKTCNGRITAES